MFSLKNILFIMGAMLGASLRFVTMSIFDINSQIFPLGVFIANICGCFCFGYLSNIFIKYEKYTTEIRFALLSGFCGAYTTFSSFILDSYNHILANSYFTLFFNMFGEIALGLCALRFGIKLAQKRNMLVAG